MRLLGRLIEWAGNEGPVELGKLEALCASLEGPVYDACSSTASLRGFAAPWRAPSSPLSGGKLTVERAPSRRTGGKTGHRRKGPFTKPR